MSLLIRNLLLCCCGLFALLVCDRAEGQVTVLGGNQLMNITTGVAGGQPAAVQNTNSTLRYKRRNVVQRITVATSCPSQRFTLKVVATNVTSGVAAPQVTLVNGTPAVNFITNIATGSANATCTLQYTASATFAQGNSVELGNDIHTITYTILAP